MKKRILSIFLIVVMLVTMLPAYTISSFAATSGDFEYRILDDGTAEITGYTGSATKLKIPSEIDGYTITTIGSYAFQYCTKITSVTIPNSVITIGYKAFYYCTSLTSVTIPDSVVTIGQDAFGFCEKISSVELGNSVTTIEPYTFEYCYQLRSVTIPKSVKTISYAAFYNIGSNYTVYVYYFGTKEEWKKISISSSLNDSIVNANIHYFSNSVIMPPTCTKQGYTKYICEDGDAYYYKDYVDATGHDYDSVITLPTCTEQGYTTYTCECGDGYVTDYVDATGHSYKNGVCDVCGIFTGIKDNHFYKNDVMQKAYQLVEFDGDFYYIGDRHEIVKNKKVYIKADRLNGLTFSDGTAITAGYYEFDADGKMVILNGVVGNNIYKNNVQLKAYQLVEIDGDFYYIGDRHEIVKNKKVYIKADRLNGLTFSDGTAITAGYYEFDADGKMVILNGVVGNHIYKNNTMLKAYQLVEFEGNFYYIGDRHQIVKDKKVYIKAERLNGLTYADGTPITAGYYNFDENGKMIIE